MAKLSFKISFLLVLVISLSFQYSNTLEPKNQLRLSQTQRVIQSLSSLPLYFVENKGQVNESVKYQLKMPSANVYFTPEEIVYQFFQRKGEGETEEGRLDSKEKEDGGEIKVENIMMRFVGANERVKVEGLEENKARFSYFQGKDPRKWVSGARTYGKVLYRELYPQIDLMVY